MRQWSALLVAAATALADPAAAAEVLDIALSEGDSPELSRKLRAEIGFAGFVAVDGARRTDQTPASIRVLSADRVQLSVQRASDTTRFEQMLERRPAEGESFALRVVEELRARLVDVGWTLPARSGTQEQPLANAPPPNALPAQPSGEPSLEPSVESPTIAGPATAERAEPTSIGGDPGGLRLWLGAGATGAWSFGGLGVTPHAALSLRAELGPDWGAVLTANLPLMSTGLDAAEGEADVTWSALTAAVEHTLPLPSGWHAGVGLGAGLFLLDAEGHANADFSGQDEQLVCGAVFVQLSLARELTGWLRLRATATTGSTTPRPVLRFDGREVASLGRGYASLGLALELGWPSRDPVEASP